MKLKERIKALDDFFGILVWFAEFIIAIILASSLVIPHLLLFSLPAVAFFLWTVLFIYAYRARLKFYDEFEMRFLETARAIGYFFFLVFAIPANSLIAIYSSPLSASSAMVAIVIAAAVGIGLELILWTLVRLFFTEQISLFEKEQIEQFKKILSNVGSASVFYSTAIAGFDLVIIHFASFLNIFAMLALVAIYAIPFYVIYARENTSRKLALALANSLKQTRLRKKYEYRLERKRKKAKGT